MSNRITIELPESMQPLERGERFELPLCELFDRIGGTIIGSGTFYMSGKGMISEIEVEVLEIETAIPEIIKILSAGNAPVGSKITRSSGIKSLLYLKPN